MRPTESFIRSSIPCILQERLVDIEDKQREIAECVNNSVRQSKSVFLPEKVDTVLTNTRLWKLMLCDFCVPFLG